jgi:chaperonin GroEL (HSP60 family)
VAEVVKSSLGPKGMDKMLVGSFGDVTITNDGATMLKEMDIQHPAAKIMVEVSKTQDDEVGDGTTSVVVLTGELLGKAVDLMAKKIHPTVVIDGYRDAQEQALKVLEEISVKVDPKDKEALKKVAVTSMASKLISGSGGRRRVRGRLGHGEDREETRRLHRRHKPCSRAHHRQGGGSQRHAQARGGR